jgi:hypothetical protein
VTASGKEYGHDFGSTVMLMSRPYALDSHATRASSQTHGEPAEAPAGIGRNVA